MTSLCITALLQFSGVTCSGTRRGASPAVTQCTADDDAATLGGRPVTIPLIEGRALEAPKLKGTNFRLWTLEDV
jgi:hypothetical protein